MIPEEQKEFDAGEIETVYFPGLIITRSFETLIALIQHND